MKLPTIEDIAALQRVCDAVGSELEYVCPVMMFESGMCPSQRNSSSSATGLIQFMADKNGKYFGYTRDQFAALSFQQQLPYVQAHFMPYKGKLTSISAVYQAVFLPASLEYATEPEDVVCGSRAGDPYPWAWRANRWQFDPMNKGYITCADLEREAKEACVGWRWEQIRALIESGSSPTA